MIKVVTEDLQKEMLFNDKEMKIKSGHKKDQIIKKY